jgi:hypothetical protein
VLAPGAEFRGKAVPKGLLSCAKGESDWNKFKTGLREGWGERRAKMNKNY